MTTGRINQVAAFRYFNLDGPRARVGFVLFLCWKKRIPRRGWGVCIERALRRDFSQSVESRIDLRHSLEFRSCSVPRLRASARARSCSRATAAWAPPIAGFAAPVLRSITSKPPSALDIQHVSAGRPVPRGRVAWCIDTEGWSATIEPYNPIYKQCQRLVAPTHMGSRS